MYSTFNQRVNANVEKLLNGASPYKVFLEAETRQEILQSLRNYEIIKQWKDDPLHETRQFEMWRDFECSSESYNHAVDDCWYDYCMDCCLDGPIPDSFWEEFYFKYDEIKKGISEDIPSDRELWILRQARKAAKLFGFGYWNTGMKKAWPKFAQEYHITTQEADAFWIEYYNNL